MGKHTDHPTEPRTCFACGAQRPRRDMHPFGYHGDTVGVRLRQVTCDDCTAAMNQPTVPQIDDMKVLA